MPVRYLLLFAVFFAPLWGCDAADVTSASPALSTSEAVDVGGYLVTGTPSADGRSFTFTVDGSGVPANLNYVFVEEACVDDPASLSPSNAVSTTTNTDADTTLAGVEWQQGLGEGQIRGYTMTFDEPQEVGAVTVVIRSGSTVATGLVTGPCGNLFDLTGAVYVDDEDGSGTTREPEELGIQDVLVEARDASGAVVATATTDDQGRYAFRLVRGDYTVAIPDTAPDQFNGTLSESYIAVGSNPAAVTLDRDVSAIDFGYVPDKQVVLDQLTVGDFVTDGDPVSEWVRRIRRAQRGRSFSDDGVQTSAAEVAGWLDAIFASPGEGPDGYFGLSDPYPLAAGADPFDAALDVLTTRIKRTSSDAEIVYVELFAMQLNFLSGRGSGNALYDETLIEYYEEQVFRTRSVAAALTTTAGPVTASLQSLDTSITRAFNGGGGGGEVG